MVYHEIYHASLVFSSYTHEPPMYQVKFGRVDWLGNLMTFFVICFVLLFSIEI